jgi:hypothetical protein
LTLEVAMKLLLIVILLLTLVGCAPKIAMDKYNSDIELANSEISKANATIQALNATATALAPRLETAEAGYEAMSAAAESAKSEASSQRSRAQSLATTLTKLAPTATLPCPSGQVVTGEGTCAAPTSTLPPTATQDPTRRSRSDGFYLVGTEFSPGLWRSQGIGDSCYWEITSKTGNIINNHFGMAGGTMYVRSTDFQVRLEDCGTWVFISP